MKAKKRQKNFWNTPKGQERIKELKTLRKYELKKSRLFNILKK